MYFRVSSLVIRCQCFFNIAPIWMVVLSNGTIKGRSLGVIDSIMPAAAHIQYYEEDVTLIRWNALLSDKLIWATIKLHN